MRLEKDLFVVTFWMNNQFTECDEHIKMIMLAVDEADVNVQLYNWEDEHSDCYIDYESVHIEKISPYNSKIITVQNIV